MSTIDPKKLIPNPANAIFDPLPEDVYQALKDDIAERGLLNPILCTPDYTVIAGHHRLKAALELGMASVPVEIQNVDDEEAESRLIADNVLRRQLNPMEQARLIKRLKERAGIRQGTRATSVTFTEVAEAVGVKPETAKQLNRLNQLISPLQDLVSAGKLGASHGVALAALAPDQQQALWDAIGESITRLKVADIQAAKQPPDTRGLEAQIAALQAERARLQAQLADQPSTEQMAALEERLRAAEAAQQAAWAEVERLRAQQPIDRIVQRIVPDPVQARRIEELEAQIAAFQPIAERMEQHATLQKDIARLEAERRNAEGRLHSMRRVMDKVDAAMGTDPDEQYRLALTQFVMHARTRLRGLHDEWRTVAQMHPAPMVPGLEPDIRVILEILQELGDGLTALPHQPTQDAPAPVVRPFAANEDPPGAD